MNVRPIKAGEAQPVIDLLNDSCAHSQMVPPPGEQSLGEFTEGRFDRKLCFVEVVDDSVRSAAFGWPESDCAEWTMYRVCAATDAWGQCATIGPALEFLKTASRNGAGNITVKGWLDEPYLDFIKAVGAHGFELVRENTMMVADLREPSWPIQPVSPGHAVRTYRPGDDINWAAVRNVVFGDEIEPKDFWRQAFWGVQFPRDFDPDGFLFAEATDQPRQVVGISAGIAICGRPAPYGKCTGIIGWTAACPEHRGKGLGMCLVANSLNYLMGQEVFYCEVCTQRHRKAAVHIYQRSGFRIRNVELTSKPK